MNRSPKCTDFWYCVKQASDLTYQNCKTEWITCSQILCLVQMSFFLFQTHYRHCHLLIIPETNEGKNILGQYIQIHNLSYIIYLWGGSSLTLLIVSCSCADRDLSWRLIASASCTWRNVISSWLGLLLCVLEKTTPTLLLYV